MTVAGIAIAMAILAVVLHGIMARWLPRRIRIPALGGCSLAVAGIFIAGSFLLKPDVTAQQWALSIILMLSFMIDYAIVFTGIQSDSPTVAFVNEILDRGEAGLPVAALEDFVRRHPFVRSRLDALVESGVLVDERGAFAARGKVGLLVSLAEFYRRLCGYQEETG